MEIYVQPMFYIGRLLVQGMFNRFIYNMHDCFKFFVRKGKLEGIFYRDLSFVLERLLSLF